MTTLAKQPVPDTGDLATVTPIRREQTYAMRIENIRVVGRHRKDLGDLDGLMTSIREIGLLQPILVTRDGRLVAGQRRLEACRRLGWEAVPTTWAEQLEDAASLLKAERDENVCRKDMLPSELAALGAALEDISRVQAKQRQRAHANTAPGRPANTPGTGSGSEPQDSRDAVGDALGMSGRSYSDLSFVHKLANDAAAADEERQIARDALAEMDAGAGLKPAAGKARRRLREAHAAKKAAVNAVDRWIPHGRDKTPKAAARRRELIREHASHGWTSGQIADVLDLDAHGVRRIARTDGIPIPADEAIGRNVQKKLDSNRIVREIVASLDGIDASLRYVNFADLDPAEAQAWVGSLTDSIRRLNRLKKRLKEITG